MPASCARYQQSTVAPAHIVLPYVGITSYKRSHQYPKVICYPNQRLRPVFKANSALSTSIPIRGRHRPCAAWAIAAAVVEARNPPQYSAYCMAARMGTPWCVAPSQQPRRLWLVSVQSEVTQVPVSSGWPTVRQSQSVFGRTCLCSVSRFTVSKGWRCSLLLVSTRFCVGWSVKLRAYSCLSVGCHFHGQSFHESGTVGFCPVVRLVVFHSTVVICLLLYSQPSVTIAVGRHTFAPLGLPVPY